MAKPAAAVRTKNADFVVADMTLAGWGRRDITIA